jgi:ribonuclease HI
MTYRLYTDASGVRNMLSWAFVLKTDELTVEGSGWAYHGINQSELLAVLKGLERVQAGSEVIIYTDSVYVIQAARGHGGGFKGHLRERLLGHLTGKSVRIVKVGKGAGPCPDHTRAHHLAREVIFGALES